MRKLTITIIFAMMMLLILSMTQALDQDVYIPNSEAENLVVTCTNNGTFCSDVAVANLTIVNPNGELIINNQAMTRIGSTFNYTINGSNTTVNGDYLFTTTINDNGNTFSKSLVFTVTPSGTEASTAQGMLYVVLLVAGLFLLGACLFGAFAVDGKNKMDMGKLIEVNYGKYLKIFLFGIAYLLLIFVSYMSWQISVQFLEIGFMSLVFEYLHLMLWILLGPLAFAFVILLLVKWLMDLKLQDLAKRNLGVYDGDKRWYK